MFIFRRPAAAVIATLCFVVLYVLAVNWSSGEPNSIPIEAIQTETIGRLQ